MKLPLLLACLGSVSPLLAAALAAPSAAPSAALAQDKAAEFKSKLRPAIAIRNYDEVTKLLKSYQDEAVNYVDELAAQMASANSDEIEKEFELLTKCWKDAYKSDFVSKIYVYHSNLATDPPKRKQRYVLIDQFRTTMAKFEANRTGAKEGPAFELCSAEFVAITDGFESIGDFFMAARTASAVAICHDITYRAKGEEDLKKTCEYYGKATAGFEKVDLKHNFYQQCKQRWEWLVREGFGAPAPADPNAPTPPAQPKAEPAAAPVTVSTAGSLAQTATTGSGRKTKTWCRTMTTARTAATYSLKCNLGSKGRRYLKKRSLALTVKTTLRAATGASATNTRKLTIKRKR